MSKPSKVLAAVVGLGMGLTVTAGATTQAAPNDAAPLVQAKGDKVSGSYIVMLKETSGMSAQAAVSNAAARATDKGAKVTHEYKAVRGYAAKLTAAQLAEVRTDPAVAFVEEDGIMTAMGSQSGATWGIDRVDQRNLPLNQTYTWTNTGAGVTAYIIDTGLNSSHSEFSGRVKSGYGAISDGQGTNDCNGHGTHVAGTVAGTTYGVAKQATVVPVRVLNCEGSGSNSGIIAGMDWVAQNHSGPSVANMSLGGGASSSVDSAVARLTSSGVTVAVASGNDNGDACNYSPARAASAITVNSTTSSDARSSFSNYGSCTDIFAPGSNVKSAWIGGSSATNTISGTSMASPHVAGVAALILQSNPSWSPTQVTNEIINDSTKNVVSDAKGSANRLLYSDPNSGGGTPTDPTPTPDPTNPNPVPSSLVNGDFEQGPSAGWTGDTHTINTSTYSAASGQYKAWLNGYGESNTEQIAQGFTVPSNGKLSFKLRVDSSETTAYTAYDKLNVQLLSSSGTVLKTLGTYSNLNEASTYQAKSFDLSSYAGQSVQIRFTGTEDSYSQTSFLIDDVAVS